MFNFEHNILIITLVVVCILVCILAFLGFIFNKFHLDKMLEVPPSRPIMPQFSPPNNLTPASMGFISELFFNNNCLVAELLDLEARGLVSINFEEKITPSPKFSEKIVKFFSKFINNHERIFLVLSTEVNNINLSSYDQELIACFFTQSKISSLHSNTSDIYKTQLNSINIHRFKRIVLSHVESTLISYTKNSINPLKIIFYLRRFFLKNETIFYIVIILLGLLYILYEKMMTTLFILGLIPFLLFYIYRVFMPRSHEGEIVYEEIKAFKLYLKTDEKDLIETLELNLDIDEKDLTEITKNLPVKTVDLYKHYLPYAVAFGVDDQWINKFSSIFDRLKQENPSSQILEIRDFDQLKKLKDTIYYLKSYDI